MENRPLLNPWNLNLNVSDACFASVIDAITGIPTWYRGKVDALPNDADLDPRWSITLDGQTTPVRVPKPFVICVSSTGAASHG